ncbi:MAG: YdcF family protein [Nitrospirota bacterium]
MQKVLWFLVLPPSSLVVLILAGLLLVDKRRRLGKGLIISGLALLYLLSLGHVADLLVKPLERSSPPLTEKRIAADAVVVLGGGSVDLAWLGAAPEPNGETTSRLVKGIELARRLRAPLVLSGGNGEPFATKVGDADVMAGRTRALGVSQEQMIVENLSRNTLENSHAVRKLLKGDRVILVTSAYHMKRAKAMFVRRGFTVIPAPTYFLGQTRSWSLAALIPRAGSLMHSTTAIAEWINLAWWGLRGEM